MCNLHMKIDESCSTKLLTMFYIFVTCNLINSRYLLNCTKQFDSNFIIVKHICLMSFHIGFSEATRCPAAFLHDSCQAILAGSHRQVAARCALYCAELVEASQRRTFRDWLSKSIDFI